MESGVRSRLSFLEYLLCFIKVRNGLELNRPTEFRMFFCRGKKRRIDKKDDKKIKFVRNGIM